MALPIELRMGSRGFSSRVNSSGENFLSCKRRGFSAFSARIAHGWEETLGIPEIGKINEVCQAVIRDLSYDTADLVARMHARSNPTTELLVTPGAAEIATTPARKEPWWKQAARRKRESKLEMAAVPSSITPEAAISHGDHRRNVRWKGRDRRRKKEQLFSSTAMEP